MIYYARSATKTAPNQLYTEHITNVSGNATRFWVDAVKYYSGGDANALANTLSVASIFHDLGKLDDVNQKVLAGRNQHAHLPIPHQDAGVAHLFSQREVLAALLVYSHHIGLPDLCEIQRQKPPLRLADTDMRKSIEKSLPELLRRHEGFGFQFAPDHSVRGVNSAFDFRVLFSCLTDADHGDAASASGEVSGIHDPRELRAGERLEALKAYVAALSPAKSPEEQKRNALRASFFTACLESAVDEPITECDAPVGTGKTTAVMARLLRVSTEKKLRRIFVILPFTNIIRQSVEVYRKALVLPGENPEEVVAELHHRADFKDKESRQLTALWNAPIVVTTAVAFFETLASNHPATLRRLHNLPGSAIFLDEAHTMLPTKLLPLAWQWISYTSQKWQCFWTLASGSLSRFWELEEFQIVNPEDDANQQVRNATVKNIVPVSMQTELTSAEIARVTYRRKMETLSIDALMDWLALLEGPVLVVLNTVHTAAAAAQLAAERFGKGDVLHLSTSLSACDREKTLDLVKVRLQDQGHRNWFLFATSCVEAGVDLSFRTGVREGASLASLLQLSGRVNRNCRFPDADVWTVTLDTNDPNVIRNPAWTVSARILAGFFESGVTISPALCTEAMKRELREGGISSELETLKKAEATRAFKTVDEKFRVIPDSTVPAIVDEVLIDRIERFDDSISWRDVQSGSVQIRRHFIEKYSLEESRRFPGVFLWKYGYSPFLGYMDGVIKLGGIDRDTCAIL